jgi:hypothetical protein
MPSPISYTAHQRPIGQGGFYSAHLCVGSGDAFSFVYDCGSMTSKSRLEDEIKVLGYEVGNRKLDLLVISHLDADHVNGVDGLLRSVGGVKDVFLPYLSPLERMLCMMRYPNEDETYYRLLADPEATLLELGAENIYLVGGGEDERGNVQAPNDGEPGAPPEPQNTKEMRLKLDVSRLEPDPTIPSSDQAGYTIAGGARVKRVSDKGSMYISALWKLRMFQKEGLRDTFEELMATGNYNQPSQNETSKQRRCREFLREIEIILAPDQITNEKILQAMRNPNGLASLRKAYSKIASVHNEVSLCLWHGPAFDLRTSNWTVDGFASGVTALSAIVGPWQSFRSRYDPWNAGTMLTGDLALKGPTLERFLKHYIVDLPRTLLFQLPHHGSRHNLEFSAELFHYPQLGFTSSGLRSQYLHPHLDVIERLDSDFGFDVLWSHERRGVTFNLELKPKG